MGFRRRFPTVPRTSVARFKGLREVGPRLWNVPGKPCHEVLPLPPALEALPGSMEGAVRRGVIHAFREAPPITVQGAPHERAPFRSKPLNQSFWLIVGSLDPVTFAATFDIEAGLEGMATTLVPDVAAYPVDGASPEPFLDLLPPPLQRFHVSCIDLVPDSLDAYAFLEFTVTVGGETYLDRVGIDALLDLSIDAPPNTLIEVSVANRDPLSAFLLYGTVRGWRYPVEEQGNQLSNTILKQDGAWHEPPSACSTSCGEEPGGCP